MHNICTLILMTCYHVLYVYEDQFLGICFFHRASLAMLIMYNYIRSLSKIIGSCDL